MLLGPATSVSPTWAYSGSVKLPIGFTASPRRHRRAADRIGRRDKAVLNRRRDQQQSARDIAGGKNVRRGGLQIRIDAHKAARHRVSTPAAARFSPAVFACQPTATTASDASALLRIAVPVIIHAHAVGVFSNDSISPKFSCTVDSRTAKCGGDGGRNVFVFRRQNARAAMEQLHSRAKGVEDRSDLRPRGTAANDQHRRRHRGQAPSVAVRVRELESGNVEPPTDSARAEDEFLRLQP